MPEFKEVTGKITVPASTGVEGFLRTIKEILRKPRVQNISIDRTGAVSFRRYILPEEEHRLVVDFEDLMPEAVVRNSYMEELPTIEGVSAATVIAKLFDTVANDGFQPIAFVSGAQTVFHQWFLSTTGMPLLSDATVYGLPLLRDKGIPDSALVLCASYTRESPLSDTQKSYKVEMVVLPPPMDNGVDIL